MVTFKIEHINGIKDNMGYDKKVSFFNDKNGDLEAEYYYLNDQLNYLISWGFNKGSLSEMRKSKAHKVKKPNFNLNDGWYSVENGVKNEN